MKTKTYTFLTGLLMAACLTSYGQEIVGEFMLQCDKEFWNGDIAAGFISLRNAADRLYLYIIHDDYDAIPETTTVDCPFTIYPNPVNDLLTLRFDDGTQPESVELYDLAGRLVGTKPNGLESIDLSTMTSGVYMLRVTMKDGTRYHEKILKE